MNRHLFRTLPLLALTAILAGACASDRSNGVPDTGDRDRIDAGPRDTGSDDAGPADVGTPETGADVVISGEPRLEHASDAEVRVTINSTVTLETRYLNAFDEPVADAQLRFSYGEGDPGEAQLRSLSARTNDEGIATVTLSGGGVPAQFYVDVAVADAAEVRPISFFVDVIPKDSVDYLINVYYDSELVDLQNADVLLFNDMDNTCESIGRNPYNIFGALEQLSILRLSDGTFPETAYPANRADLPLTYVVAIAYKEGAAVALGCTDGLPLDIEPGSGTEVDVFLNDLYPAIAGEYHVVNEFDIIEFLPPTVQTVVRIIGDFFESPGAALFDILDVAGIFDGEDLPFGIDGLIADVIDELLFAILPPEAVAVFESGTDIYEALENLQLQGSMIFYGDADENGVLGCNTLILDEIIVNLDTFEFPPLNLSSYGYQAAEGEFTGWISIEDDGNLTYKLNVQWFDLTINYGELAVFILETVIFPLVFDDPSMNSMEAFVESFIDCEAIADAVDLSFIEGICDGLLDAAVGGLRDLLTAQTLDAGSFYRLATPEEGSTPPTGIEILEEGMDWGPCELSTEELDDGNLRVQDLGGSGRNRCVWNARFRSDSSDPTGRAVPAAFDASRISNRVSGACSGL